MKRIFLIGFMGSGKTTLGRAFAKEEKLEFIDLDCYIENRYHKEIRQLFAERGESGFREIERDMLREVGTFDNVVIACGGGTPCFFDNMAFMNEAGMSVYLQVSPQLLFDRLSIAKAKRPLLAGKSDLELMDFIHEALAKRNPFYTQAQHRFAADELDSREQIHESVVRLRQLLK